MSTWNVHGSYYESCNCEAICPCRVQGDQPGGDTTYGSCDFVLSWFIEDGRIGEIVVADRAVVIAGQYDDDEPGKPWRVVLYLDERCDHEQHEALADLYQTSLPFSAAIAEVKRIRSASIRLDHTPNAQSIDVEPYITVRTRESVGHDERVSCAIPGHEHPGNEIIADVNRVEDLGLAWEVHGRCGFATDFAYAS